ncbi:MAG: TonB family protein [Candidatus Acidiferrales bacterium]
MNAVVPCKLTEETRADLRPPVLSVEWPSAWQDFRSSIRECFSGQRVTENTEGTASSDISAGPVRRRIPIRAMLASCAAHVAAIGLLVLPIWGFLPTPAHDLAPARVQLTWYGEPQDLPKILLPEPAPKPDSSRHSHVAAPTPGAAAFHPRQTILSEPVRVTHPRQTLIQPDAPPSPPKIAPQLPNLVEWTPAVQPPRPRLKFSSSAAAPRIQPRAVRDLAAPDIADVKNGSGPLDIAATPETNSPRMPVAPMSASLAAPRRNSSSPAAPAPEIAAKSQSDAILRRVIALSANPAPPAPVVEVPNGNLAARVAISPHGSRSRAGSNTNARNTAAAGSGASAISLPAAISVSRGNLHAANGGIGSSTRNASRPLVLKPMTTIPARPEPTSNKEPMNVARINPNLPPEALLAGKQIYTLHVNLPDLTSVTGSWTLHFAQLDDSDTSRGTADVISGPAPIHTVDPEYPESAIKEHIDGEVVLYAIVRKDGSVDSIQLVRGVDPRLDRNAMQALSHWRFHPGMRNGAPIDLEAVVHIPFEFRKAQD